MITSTFVLLLTLILSGCNTGPKYDLDYQCSKDYQGAKLNFINWGEYMDPDLVKEFERLCNAKVIYEEAFSSEAMRTKLLSGSTNYDLLAPTDYMVENLNNAGLLAEINFDNIPNFQNIDPQYLGKPYDPLNKISVPYFWGTIGIMYNTDVLEEVNVSVEELNTWEILWDDRLDNQIFMYDSERDSFMVALKLLGHSVNRGENETIEEYKVKLNAAKVKLAEQYPNVLAYGTDNIKKGIVNGDAAVGVVFSGDYLDMLFELTDEGEEVNIGYVVPQEGTNMWIDNFIIPKNSDNKELAEEFINFFLDSQVAYLNAKWVGYSTPNQAAYDLLLQDEDYKDLVIIDAYKPSSDTLENSEVYQDLGHDLNTHLSEAFISVKTN